METMNTVSIKATATNNPGKMVAMNNAPTDTDASAPYRIKPILGGIKFASMLETLVTAQLKSRL